jgi:hypothetical protein
MCGLIRTAERASPVQKLASTTVFVTRTGALSYSTVDSSQCCQQRSFYQRTTKGKRPCVGRRGTCHIQLYTARKMETCKQPPTCLSFEWRLSLYLYYCLGFRCPGFISCPRVSLPLLKAFRGFHSLHTNVEMTPKIRPRPLPSSFFPKHYSPTIRRSQRA